MYPTLINKPKDVSIKAGETIELPCKAKGHPEPQVILWREGVKKFPAAVERRMAVLPSKFVIKEAKGVDSGLYTCSAVNEAGSVNASAYVTVLGKCFSF